MAFYALEPFGEWRADVRAALVSSTVARCIAGGDLGIADFMLDFSGDTARDERKTPEELMWKAKKISALLCEMHDARQA